MGNDIFQRTELLLGTDVMTALAATKVLLVGVGGVGSWCAESLVRSGVGHLTMVDSDCVAVSNLNRQLMATSETIGQSKVETLRARLLAIYPQAHVEALQQVYSAETADTFDLASYDYVIDAIDSLENKALLLLRACEAKAVVLSSMGAALKLDPTRIAVAEFWQVKGCPLAAALRRKFKKMERFPKRKIKCVYSDELFRNKGVADAPVAGWDAAKAQINGTVAHATAIFGFTLAGLLVQNVVARTAAH